MVSISTLLLLGASSAQSQEYHQVNLVSDIPGIALHTDPHLANPWGFAFTETSPVWIASNGTGTATLYLGDGTSAPSPAAPLVLTIPGAASGSPSAPTGLIVNASSGFAVSANGKSGRSVFIFATEDCTISGWSPAVNLNNAILKVNNSTSGAMYKGLASGVSDGKDYIFATNFHEGAGEVYDSSFQFVKSFTDTSLPLGYAPFGIRNISGNLYSPSRCRTMKRKTTSQVPVTVSSTCSVLTAFGFRASLPKADLHSACFRRGADLSLAQLAG